MKKSILFTLLLLTSVVLQGCSTGQGGTTTTQPSQTETTKAETTKAETTKAETTATEATTPIESAKDTTTDTAKTQYKAGSYTADAQGYGGKVIVTITVNESQITAVSIEGPDETDGIGTKALDEMPDLILEAQTGKVDTIAGATVTSEGIIKALEAALTQASTE